MIISCQKKEPGKEADYCHVMGLGWRQADTQFKARMVVLKLDKDFKDLDDGSEDPRQPDRVEHRMDIKRTGLQNANDVLFTVMIDSIAEAPEFQFLHSLPFVTHRNQAPHYGAILDEDLDRWHRQPFGMLFHELAKDRRTTPGASAQQYASFGQVETHDSILEYGEAIAPWFQEQGQQNHASAPDLLSALRAQMNE